MFSANALLRNDDCHTPLEVARIKGCITVVRAIEVCLRYKSELYKKFFLAIVGCF